MNLGSILVVQLLSHVQRFVTPRTAARTPGFPVLLCLSGFAQIQVHWVNNANQLSHPLSPPSPPALNLSQNQDLLEYNKLPSGNKHHLLILPSFCRSGIQTGSRRVVSFLLRDFWASTRTFEAQGWNYLKVLSLQRLMVGVGCRLSPQLECLGCGLEFGLSSFKCGGWAPSQAEREREGVERGTQLRSPRSPVWGRQLVGPRRVTGRNPGPQRSMSKWKGTGIKVWPCLKNAKRPLGGHHVCEEERTGQKRKTGGARREDKVPVNFPLRTMWSPLWHTVRMNGGSYAVATPTRISF